MTRLRNILCAVFSLILLGIYYRFPIGHLTSQQSAWLVLRTMLMVFAAAIAFEWLSETMARPRGRGPVPKRGYTDAAPGAQKGRYSVP
ncbi:MAG TPA: hypothetical protein VGI93_10890 [Steroidobacteraceae bacterium]